MTVKNKRKMKLPVPEMQINDLYENMNRFKEESDGLMEMISIKITYIDNENIIHGYIIVKDVYGSRKNYNPEKSYTKKIIKANWVEAVFEDRKYLYPELRCSLLNFIEKYWCNIRYNSYVKEDDISFLDEEDLQKFDKNTMITNGFRYDHYDTFYDHIHSFNIDEYICSSLNSDIKTNNFYIGEKNNEAAD